MKLRHALFKIEPKKAKNAKYAELESDLDDEFIEQWEESLKEKEIDKAKKKFAKDNEKRAADGEKPHPDKELEKRLEAINEEFDRLADERGTDEADLKRAKPVEKIEEAIENCETKIKNFKLQMVDKEEGKEVSLGTRFVAPRL
jgi:DNA topoisomerase-1